MTTTSRPPARPTTHAPVAGRGTADALVALRRRDRRRALAVTAGLALTLAGLGALSLSLGAVPLTPTQVLAALAGTDGSPTFVVTGLRLPRLALAAAVGGALGLAGALLQAVARNALASPDVVGLTGGASAAAVLALSAGATGVTVDAAAAVGGLLAAAAVVLLSGRGVTGTRFVVVGVAVAFLCSGVLSYALTRASLTEARAAFFWLVGSVGTAPWGDVARIAGLLAVAVLVLVAARRRASHLAFDDDTARALGLRPVLARGLVVAGSSVLAAGAVAVAGPVAFVAFLSGPLARGLRGRGPALGTAVLVGAAVVVGADLLAQHAVPGSLQPPVGLVTGALGAPVLVMLLVRGERRKERPA